MKTTIKTQLNFLIISAIFISFISLNASDNFVYIPQPTTIQTLGSRALRAFTDLASSQRNLIFSLDAFRAGNLRESYPEVQSITFTPSVWGYPFSLSQFQLLAARFPNLMNIDFSQVTLERNVLYMLSRSSLAQTLRTLDISNSGISVYEFIANQLQNFTRLTALNLIGNTVRDADIEVLIKCPITTNLFRFLLDARYISKPILNKLKNQFPWIELVDEAGVQEPESYFQ